MTPQQLAVLNWQNPPQSINTEALVLPPTRGRIVARCAFAEKDLVKAAGFKWDMERRHWWTTEAEVAARLADIPAFLEALRKQHALESTSIEASRVASAEADLPRPAGLEYLPYQVAGILYAMVRSAVLFADEMGLGKTIQAIGLLNSKPELKRVLIVCPKSLMLNWRKELVKWLIHKRLIGLAEGHCRIVDRLDIVVMNYDILDRNRENLHAVKWDAIILDEAHLLKNPKAKRTQAVFGRKEQPARKGSDYVPPLPALRASVVMALTGTPIPNRVEEGFPLFHYLDPDTFKSDGYYKRRFCNGHSNGYGFDTSGSSNLDELQRMLRAQFMIRRLKKDVLKDLPPKRRKVIEFPAADLGSEVEAASEDLNRQWELKQQHIAQCRAAVELAKASEDIDDFKNAVANLGAAVSTSFAELSKLRHDLAVMKLPLVIDHLRDQINQGEKIICFAHHRDVLLALHEEFKDVGAVLVYGDTLAADRQAAVDRFQTGESCRLFIGGIIPAGVGLTLTASSHVVFAELDWVPGNVTQAEDRAHRIGQLESVLIEHLVLENSLDARMAQVLVEKQDVIDKTLDKETAPPVVPIRTSERAASEDMTRAQVTMEALGVTPAQATAALDCLRILCAFDGDHAREENGIGFNQADTFIGHSLAQRIQLTPKQAVLAIKLANKYRRQLPEELVAAAKGGKAA